MFYFLDYVVLYVGNQINTDIDLLVSTQATFKGWTDIMYAAVDSQSKVKRKVIKCCKLII